MTTRMTAITNTKGNRKDVIVVTVVINAVIQAQAQAQALAQAQAQTRPLGALRPYCLEWPTHTKEPQESHNADAQRTRQ